jgi:hypothetical protein
MLAGALLAPAAMAAVAEVILLDQTTPVAGVSVTLYTSDGQISGFTNNDGHYTAEITGKMFRVVIGEEVSGIYNAEAGPAVIQHKN